VPFPFPLRALVVPAALMLATTAFASDRASVPGEQPVTVRLYDAGELSERARASSQAEAAGILARARVPTVWVDCGSPAAKPAVAAPCSSPPGPEDLIVRLLHAAGSASGPLGYSLVDVEQRRGWLATVFVNRVDALAVAAGADRSRLLGRAMAHEVVHLLLGTTRHSLSGLMRARWRPADLARELPWDWWLSADDVWLVRHAYLSRMVQPGLPPLVVAELRQPPFAEGSLPSPSHAAGAGGANGVGHVSDPR
jgi:hypothetical protein